MRGNTWADPVPSGNGYYEMCLGMGGGREGEESCLASLTYQIRRGGGEGGLTPRPVAVGQFTGEEAKPVKKAILQSTVCCDNCVVCSITHWFIRHCDIQ